MQDTDIKNVKLVINSQDAEKKLREITTKIEAIKQKKIEAFEKGDNKGLKQYTNELKNLQKEQAKIETRAHGIERVLKNLDKATPNELRATIREINKELNSGAVERGSKEWNSLTNSIHECNEQLSKIKSETNAVHQSFTEKLSNWGQKWSGLVLNIQGLVSMLTGLKQTIRSSIQAYADMEESMAQVRKYTGWTAEQVENFNESLKKMDTRTGRDKLNSLAGDAGKLGITSQQAVKEFVDAADKINVALGDDLGDDAVKNVGKLAMMFGEDKKLGLRGAMLATGSVINELSQNSSAGAAYLEDFTARVSGVGKQANMTQAQIMGFASVLDANMQQDETAATTFSQLITRMFQNPSKFAKLAGENVKSFTTLLKTDANAAIIKFLEAMNAKGGFADLAPMFESMGLNGSRATGVLSALASKLGDVNRMQGLANKSYAEATSITNEFNVQNNTVQAHLDKAKKRFQDLTIELGQKLLPVMTFTISGTSLFIRTISVLLNFISKYKTKIGLLIATIAAYTIVLNAHYIAKMRLYVLSKAHLALVALHTAATKILTAVEMSFSVVINTLRGNLVRAAAAQRILNTVTKANPWALAITLVLSLGVALYAFINRTKELTEAEKEQLKIRKKIQDVQNESLQQTANTKARLNALKSIIDDNNQSLRQRKAALVELKKIVPEYHGYLDKEGKLINDNSNAITTYIKNLDKMVLAQALAKKMEENAAKQINAELAVESWKAAVQFRENRMKQSGHESKIVQKYEQTGISTGQIISEETNDTRIADEKLLNIDQQRLKAHSKTLESLKNEKQAYKDLATKKGLTKLVTDYFINENTLDENNNGKEKNKNGKNGNKDEGSSNTQTGKKEDPIKSSLEKITKQTEAEKVQRQLEYQAGLIDKREYEDNLVAIEDESLKQQQSLYKKGSDEWNKLEIKRQENEVKTIQQFNDWSLQDIDRQEKEELEKKKENFADGIMDEKQYQQATLDIKREFLKRRAAYLHSVGSEEDSIKYEQQVRDLDQDDQINKRKEFIQKWNELEKQIAPEMAEAGKLQEQYHKDQQFLQDSLNKKLITQEQFNQSSKQLQDKYNSDLKNVSDKAAEKLGMPTDQFSSTFIMLGRNIEDLQQKLKNGQADWHDYAAIAVDSLNLISSVFSAAANFYQAEQDAETEKVNEKYDKEIEAAGTSTARGKALETKKQKELAEVKNKYNKKAEAMQIASAIASTALSAINAYSSAAQVPFIGYILAPIAATMAIAAGMLQVATIKKQHQNSGYYTGGYTGGSNYHHEAGVVHEGEFVANHQAVQNPNLKPMFQMLDYAQRNNTVGSLSTSDVSRAILAPQTTAGATVQTASNTEQVANNDAGAAAIDRLNDNLDKGINAVVVIDGPDGLDRQYTKYKKLKSRA